MAADLVTATHGDSAAAEHWVQGHSRFTQHVRLCQPSESPAQGIELVTITDDHETLTSSMGQLVITLRLPLKNLSCNITQIFTWQSEEPARLPSAFLSRAEPSVSPRSCCSLVLCSPSLHRMRHQELSGKRREGSRSWLGRQRSRWGQHGPRQRYK